MCVDIINLLFGPFSSCFLIFRLIELEVKCYISPTIVYLVLTGLHVPWEECFLHIEEFMGKESIMDQFLKVSTIFLLNAQESCASIY